MQDSGDGLPMFMKDKEDENEEGEGYDDGFASLESPGNVGNIVKHKVGQGGVHTHVGHVVMHHHHGE